MHCNDVRLAVFRRVFVLAGACLTLFLVFLAPRVFAIDVIKANIGESNTDQRIHFKHEVLQRALELTRQEFGDYRMDVRKSYMNVGRSFVELESGRNLTVYIAHTSQDLENHAIPIRIPVRMGLASYRLLLIKDGTAAMFAHVHTMDDLKKLKMGLDSGWTTYPLMVKHGFNIVTVADYESMFRMLSLKRFAFMPRALNEIYGEIDFMRASNTFGLSIEPTLALYISSATYIFVSKQQPRIAERLQLGVERMRDNGDLKAVFDKYFLESVVRAQLDKRRIIYIENPLLPKSVPIQDQRYWYQPERDRL